MMKLSKLFKQRKASAAGDREITAKPDPNVRADSNLQHDRVNTANFRYIIEHRIMPQQFFGDPQTWIDALQHRSIFVFWEILMKKNDIANPYEPSDFITRTL